MREAHAHHLANLAVNALIKEASLTPKPGLVDQVSNGAHDDMDYDLLIRSAESLRQTFYDIAHYSYQHPINQELRENIAKIGRMGEQSMLKTTDNINTHKGAIWTLGLMISIVASNNKPMDARSILTQCGLLASFADRFYHTIHPTKGMNMQKKYGIKGALDEAQQGFPSISASLIFFQNQNDTSDNHVIWINQLLYLMSIVDDTCILSRSDLIQLKTIQSFAKEILAKNGYGTQEGQKLYQDLCQYCLDHQLSPGGSADLLAGMIFLQELGAINGTTTI